MALINLFDSKSVCDGIKLGLERKAKKIAEDIAIEDAEKIRSEIMAEIARVQFEVLTTKNIMSDRYEVVVAVKDFKEVQGE